jgi:hypothetical protein
MDAAASFMDVTSRKGFSEDTSGVATVEDVRLSCMLCTYFLVSERASKQGFDSGNVVSITSGADTGLGMDGGQRKCVMSAGKRG